MTETPRKVYDVAVIGGGVVGSAAAWRAAKRLAADGGSGDGVLLLEQFERGHVKGSSHGDGRIFRVAYEEADYVAMAKFALEAWRELEAASGEELLLTTGGITIANKDNAWTLDELCATFEAFGFEYERLSAEAATKRFPQYHLSAEEGEEAVFQAAAGILRATKCVEAMWGQAAALGATTVEGERMGSIRPLKEEGGAEVLEITTEAGNTYHAKSVVLAMGAWTGKEAAGVGSPEVLPLQVTEETVGYFEPKDGVDLDHSYHHMPVFLHRAPNGMVGRVDQGFYGLPQVEVKGVKVAAHHVGPEIDPDKRGVNGEEGGEETTEAMRRKALETTCAFVARVFPHLNPTPSTTLTCLYTVTPDHDFVLDAHPTLPKVYVAAGFSGHGFKFGSALGEIMACLALGQAYPPLLEQAMAKERFSLRRFKDGKRGEERNVYR